jgi:HlyD family secretion protein
MSRLFDAIQKADGQLGEIGRSLVNVPPADSSVRDDEVVSRVEAPAAETATATREAERAPMPQPLVKPELPGPLVEAAPPPAPKRRRPVLAVLLSGVLLAAAYSGYRVYSGQSVLPSWAAHAAPPNDMRFTGVVVAQETVVSAKVGGRIESLAVDEGSLVNAGDIIATLDRQELDAERDNQRAKVDQLNARLLQSQEMLRLETERNEHQLERAAAQVKAAESDLRTAQVELEQSRSDLNRGRELRRAGVIAANEMERYETAVQVNEARAKSLEEKVQASRADLEVMRANVRQVAVAASDVDQTRAELVQAQAVRQQTYVRSEYTIVRAPMSGLVSVRVATQGEVVGPGAPIVSIVDLQDMWVKADVEETWINRIRIGARLPVQLASGERTTGEVFFISPEAEFATQRDINRVKRDVRTFGIKVRLANESRRIHPGMTAYVMLPDSSAAGVQ